MVKYQAEKIEKTRGIPMKKRAIALIAAAVMILSLFSACSSGKKSGAAVIEKNIVSPSVSKTNFGFSNTAREKLLSVCVNNMTTLYFDEKTFSIGVYDSGSGKLWRALPENESGENAAVLSLKVLVGNDEYTLDSQSDSVAQGNAKYDLGNDGVTVSYGFQKKLGEKDISITVPVRFTAADGMLVSSVDCKSIEVNGGAVIEELSLLGFFGADSDGKSGDFMLVPDGCGAIIDTAQKADKFDNISLSVYGGDPSLGESDFDEVYVPTFGKKSGNGAFVALVESGDAIAKINAEKALKKSGLNRVWTAFEITQTASDGEKTYVSDSSYDGFVSVSYRFLSGDNANYVSMASACRELLIRSSVLSMNERTVSQSEGFPFELTLVASAKLKGSSRRNEEQKVLTTLSQARDVISFLRSKGIKNIAVRLKGLFEGGLLQNNFSSATLFSSVGTKKELEDFMDYAKSQNISVYADVGLFTASNPNADGAVKISGKSSEKKLELLKNDFVSSEVSARFSPAEKIEKNANSLIAALRGFGFDGVSLSDAGNVLYSDHTKKNGSTRDTIKKTVALQCAALSSSKKVMVGGANVYALKYASAVSGLSNTAKCAKNELCTAVPFVQSILHGYVDYSHTAFNKTKNSENAFLKAVEYGAVPSAEMYFLNFGTDEKKDGFYYMNAANNAQQYYERASAAFSDLRDKKITAHRKIRNGVFCTEYGSSASVYVNYSKKDVTVGGVTVEAKSFVRVG